MNMEKKTYWLVSSNGDVSVTCTNLTQCQEIIEIDFESLDQEGKEETVYTITPLLLTDEEYENLPEAEF